MTEFTRKELYKQVWKTPMLKLAEKYGLSDVGLAEICKKHDIPKPAGGYWSQVKAGGKPDMLWLSEGFIFRERFLA